MKIAIIGAGAIGSVVAAYLHKAGEDVVLVGREDQVQAVNQNGLTVKGINGQENFKLKALTQLDCEVDLAIFATKTQDLAFAYTHNQETLENCEVLTTQNGVQADNILSCHFGREKMFSSIVMFGATYIKPGEVTYNFKGDWIIGRPFLPVNPKTHKIAEVLGKAFHTVISMDITGMKWLKLFVNFNNCIPALIGKSMQETYSDMDFCRLSIELLKEGYDIVQKGGAKLVSLPEFPKERIEGLVKMPVEQAAGIINQTLPKLSKEPLYGSILQSIMRGKMSEIEFINGEVVHMAQQMQMGAPLNGLILEMVHQVEESKKYFQPEEVKQKFNIQSSEASK